MLPLVFIFSEGRNTRFYKARTEREKANERNFPNSVPVVTGTWYESTAQGHRTRIDTCRTMTPKIYS